MPAADKADNADNGDQEMKEANEKMEDFFQNLPKGFFTHRPMEAETDIATC